MSVPLHIDESKFTCKFGKRTKTEFKVVQTSKQGKQGTKCCSINVKHGGSLLRQQSGNYVEPVKVTKLIG